jgi:transglutaminase-like putative cysteine protease
LAVVSAAAFGRVYQGHGSTLRLCFVALLALGIAAALERRSLVLATLASAAGLVIAASLLVFPDTTMGGLPTLDTLHAAAAAFGSVARTSAVEVAPAPPLAPLFLAGVTAAWTAAFAAHALAVRARSPLLAIAPPASLLVFAGIVMGDGARPMYVFVFLAAGLAVLFSDALRRVASWGPVSVWHERRSIRSGGGTTARGAWRVAISCVVVALFMPWILPGFGSRALLSVRGGVASQVSIDPTVDIRPRLLQNPETQLFVAQSSRPSYWRFMTLDTFNGRHWTSSHSLTGGSTPIGNQLASQLPQLPCVNANTSDPIALRDFPQSCPPGYPDSGPTVLALQQHFTFGPLAQPWLPLAPEPMSAGIAGQDVRFDPDTGALVYPNGTFKGFSYGALSLAVVPTPAELRSVASLEVPDNPNWTHYVALPDNIPPQISQIATKIVTDAQATTPYDQILAIQDYLQNFHYDTHVRAPTGVNDLLFFLTKSHRGYCEQFAGTMAVMLRALGIPARVAVGFTPGTYESTGRSYSVTTQNAHSWVEVEFPGYGWLAFEPTPTRNNPVASSYDAPVTTGGIGSCQNPLPRGRGCADGPGIGGAGGPGGALSGPAQKLLHPDLGGPIVTPTAARAPRPEPLADRLRRYGVLVGVGLLVLLLIATPPVKSLRRRMRLRSGRHGAEARVTAAYEVLCEEAADVGLGRRPFETPNEYRRRLVAFAPSCDAALGRLTDLTIRANYALNGIGPPEADEAASLSRDVARALRRATPGIRRVVGMYRIGSWDPGDRWLPAGGAEVTPRASLRA